MKRFLVTFLFVFHFIEIWGQSYSDKITEMMSLSGEAEQFDLIISQLLEIQKNQSNELDLLYWEKLEKVFKDSIKSSLLEGIIPIYEKHLSEQNIDDIIKFYKTESGKALIEKSPQIMTEAMNLGQGLGVKLNLIVKKVIYQEKEEKFNTEYPICEFELPGKYNMYIGGVLIKSERTENEQVDRVNEFENIYSINWINDSKYTLKLESSNNPNLIKNSDLVYTVNLIFCERNRIKFLIQENGRSDIFDGLMNKVSD